AGARPSASRCQSVARFRPAIFVVQLFPDFSGADSDWIAFPTGLGTAERGSGNAAGLGLYSSGGAKALSWRRTRPGLFRRADRRCGRSRIRLVNVVRLENDLAGSRGNVVADLSPFRCE